MPTRWLWLPSPGAGPERTQRVLEVVPLRRTVRARPVSAGVVLDLDARLLLDETRPSERWVEEAVARGRLWRAAKEAK